MFESRFEITLAIVIAYLLIGTIFGVAERKFEAESVQRFKQNAGINTAAFLIIVLAWPLAALLYGTRHLHQEDI